MISSHLMPLSGLDVTVERIAESPSRARVTYRQKLNRAEKRAGAKPDQCTAEVALDPSTPLKWVATPGERFAGSDIESDADKRGKIALVWLERLDALIQEVASIAEECDWSTRIIEIPRTDLEIGSYLAPALLLQKHAVKLQLEPIAKDAPGTQGSADLYRMPEYDDIAALYFYEGRWNVHYFPSHDFPDDSGPISFRDAPGRSLTKQTLQAVLEEMFQHEA